LSCISYITSQKWLVFCSVIKDPEITGAISVQFTQVEQDNAFRNLLIMCADGMSSEDSEYPTTGGILLRKRRAVW